LKTKKRTLIRGSDDVGRFVISGGTCIHCRKNTICVKYAPKSASLANWNIVTPESTIIRDWSNRLGIPCGCYAKFHRQITHIFEKTEHKHRKAAQAE
jgi:hypothetical protein